MENPVLERVVVELEQSFRHLDAMDWGRPLVAFIDPINTALALQRILLSVELSATEHREIARRLGPFLKLNIMWSSPGLQLKHRLAQWENETEIE